MCHPSVVLPWYAALLLLAPLQVVSVLNDDDFLSSLYENDDAWPTRGEDIVCWQTQAASTTEVGDHYYSDPIIPVLGDPLVSNFSINLDETVLLDLGPSSCPEGNTLMAEAPKDLKEYHLQIGTSYNFTVNMTLNLDSLGGEAFVSDNNTHLVAVEMIACDDLYTGFCDALLMDHLPEFPFYQPIVAGERHWYTHVHSHYVILEVDPADGPRYEFSVQVPMTVHAPGYTFVVAAAHMYVSNTTTLPATMRFDMSVPLSGGGRWIYYADDSAVNTYSIILLISFISIAIVGSIITFLLFQTIKHRNHQVLRLTQAPFLIAFLLSGWVATVCVFLLSPYWGCNAGPPIILCSLQLFYSITLGRLWRINRVISPLLMKSLHQESWTSRVWRKCKTCFLGNSPGNETKTLRVTVTQAQLAGFVAIFTLPQVIIQILSITLQPRQMDIEISDSGDYLGDFCLYYDPTGEPDPYSWNLLPRRNLPMGHTFLFYGLLLFILLVLVLLLSANATRDIPSLLFESHAIFDTTLSSLLLLTLGMGIMGATMSSADAVHYLIWVAVVHSMTLVCSWRIMMPKLRMVWNDERIIVSELMSDHNAKIRRSNEPKKTSGPHVKVTGLKNFAMSFTGRKSALNNPVLTQATEQESTTAQPSSPPEESPNHLTVPSLIPEEDGSNDGDDDGNERPRRRTLISPSAPPSEALMLELLEVKATLENVTGRMMSGRMISNEDWTSLRNAAHELEQTFQEDIKFAWEQSQSGGLEMVSLLSADARDDTHQSSGSDQKPAHEATGDRPQDIQPETTNGHSVQEVPVQESTAQSVDRFL